MNDNTTAATATGTLPPLARLARLTNSILGADTAMPPELVQQATAMAERVATMPTDEFEREWRRTLQIAIANFHTIIHTPAAEIPQLVERLSAEAGGVR